MNLNALFTDTWSLPTLHALGFVLVLGIKLKFAVVEDHEVVVGVHCLVTKLIETFWGHFKLETTYSIHTKVSMVNNYLETYVIQVGDY